MTSMLLSQNQALVWIVSLVWITTNGESCPKGARTHLDSLRCYWLSETTSSWFEARDACRDSHGGALASAESLELQNFISISFSARTTEWVWLQGLGQGEHEDGVVVPQSPVWVDEDSERQDVCRQIALGTVGQWRTTQCTGKFLYLCEDKVTDSLPSTDSYLTGLVLMTGFYTNTQIHPLLSAPDIGKQTVEVQLFPGLWFSHAGQLASVEVAVRPSPVSTLARVQILRPYCKPNHHLVPPGCSALLNPFSCCSAVPLCNTTGGCGAGQYWCHLLEACVPTASPCSPYDSAAGGRGFALPPRYIALPPFYHLAADFPLRVKPSAEPTTLSVVLPEQAIMVYPDDIVAIQHTLDSGTFLHCLKSEASLNSAWRQSYLSFRGTEWGGWVEGGLTSLPQGSRWVDGVVCDLRMLYVDALHRATDHEDILDSAHTDATATSDLKPPTAGPDPSARSKFGLGVVHPLPDQNNRIHVQTNVPTLIVVKASSAEEATSSWSAPVLQAGLPFLPSCPGGLDPPPPGCGSRDAWFSSVTLALPSAGVRVLNVSVADAEGSQSVAVQLCGYEAVAGLSVRPHGCPRMLVDASQSFTAKVERGSNVKFTWVVDDLQEFAHEGESYSVMFKKPAGYKLQVTASNPISSQSQQIHLTADEAATFASPEFQFVEEVVAVDATSVYTIKVEADISLPVTFRWDFGDGGDGVIHTQSAPCRTMSLTGDRRVYVQDSVNKTYSTAENYRLHVHVSNQFGSTEASMEIKVRPQLLTLLISPPASPPVVKQRLRLEAFVAPSDSSVSYTWDFGDGSEPVQSPRSETSHTFGSAGVYNVTVRADNTLTSLTAWLLLVVVEKVSGLTVTCGGPQEAGSATEFRAEVQSGSDPVWDFDFGDGCLLGNLTAGYITHIYKLPGNYRVDVTVSNPVSEARQSIAVEIYSLTISGILPTGCVPTGHDVQLTALLNGDATILTFHWVFGDTPAVVVRGQPTVTHRFPSNGFLPINLTVLSAVTTVSFSSSICVQSPISDIVMQRSKDVAAVGDEICVTVLVSPLQPADYQFEWFTVSSGLAATTGNSEKCFVFGDDGVEDVSVTVSNKVSNKTAKTSITVQKPIGTFSIAHDTRGDTVTAEASVSFWVAGCAGTDVSVVWDFGDGSPPERTRNVSHVFASAGRFLVTAAAFNDVSRGTAALKVEVSPPVSDLSLRASRPYAAVGEETVITAVSSDPSAADYNWRVVGVTSSQRGNDRFSFVAQEAGVYQVRVTARNSAGEREAAISIEVLERIQGLQVKCQSLTNGKYIPTHDEVEFIASVAKGSNVTYRWLATQSEQEVTGGGGGGGGELFHVTAELPGSVSVRLTASNELGQATSGVSLVAVERITGTRLTTPSDAVAPGEVVNVTVVVDTGSDLRYFWHVEANGSPVRTDAPFILRAFTSLGERLVGVSVQNAISQGNDTKVLLVQEEVQNVDFEIESQKHPIYVNASVELSFRGFVSKGSDLHWEWRVQTSNQNFYTSTNQTFLYTFPHAGIFEVCLNVSNVLSYQAVSHGVTVQDAIEGLALNVSRSSLCAGEQVTFLPSVTRGTNVSFVITFQNGDWTLSEDISDGRFTSSDHPAGQNLVTVRASNQVSSAAAASSSAVLVTEPIRGLRLVNCCSATLEALKGKRFRAEVESGFPVDYSWTFRLEGSAPVRLVGEEVVFAPPGEGLLSVGVTVNNGSCSQMLRTTVLVERPLKEVKLLCHSQNIFVGHAVWFSATSEGSDVRFLWDFGDSTEKVLTDISNHSHTYYYAGKFTVTVQVLNNVSQVSTQLLVEVEALRCSGPRASLIQSETTVFRSRPSFFEASVDVNCTGYKTTYLWEVFREPCCADAGAPLFAGKVYEEDAASPFISLPKRSLEVGRYCLVFTASLQRTPLSVRRRTSVTVVHSPLVAVIKGGSHRLWSSLSDLVLDGSDSRDPDLEPGVEETLRYDWACVMANSSEPLSVNQPAESISSRMTVLSMQLRPGTVYDFTLTVHKKGRRSSSFKQTVTVIEAAVLPVSVHCLSCSSAQRISYTTPVVLTGQCGQCDDQAQYKWRAVDQSGQFLDLDEVTTSTGRHSPNLVVRSGVLQPGQSYSFALDVSEPGGGRSGNASLLVEPNDPPRGGLCHLSPEANIRLLETVVTYSCSGWQSEESSASQLIYTFQVALCQPISSVCPLLTLYRGTQSTFGSLVPVGIPGHRNNTTVITVSLQVEDHLGAKVIVLNRTLMVENPKSNEVVGEWLKNKSQTELRALVQGGNPQEIVPYSIALISKLNQVELQTTLADRREIRQNVTQALTSLPVSSIMDVEQLSSALSQTTAFPSELVCPRCQVKVLDAVGKMIHVLKEQTSPAVVPAVNVGRNILSVIGSTLSAVSQSATSHTANSSTRWAAHGVAFLALGHAGELMRALMRSRVHGEAPLSLSNDYINTLAFQGRPSELLCSHQSAQHHVAAPESPGGFKHPGPCRFDIPAPLTARLQAGRAEVVQVLFGTDGAPEADALLSSAEPPISTSLVAMELSTPQGQPIPVRDLDPEQAIRVTLPNRDPVGHGVGGGDWRDGEAGNETCLAVTVPADGRLNFTVKALEDLDSNAGLYITFNFTLAPGAAPVSLGHVRVEVSSATPDNDASQDPLVRTWSLTLLTPTSSSEETIFLSPLWNGTDGPLSVNLTSSLVDGGPARVSVCVFSSVCRFYSLREKRWSSEGLRPLEGSTLRAARCLTQHLTMFGASLFVHPGAVVLLPPTPGPARNLLVGIVCAVLVLIHLLVGLIAHKLDHLDSLRLSQVPLCGRPGLHHYRVLVKTGRRPGAGTTAHVGISLYGVNKSGARHLQRDGAFQRGALDQFHVETDDNLGEVWKVRIWHDNTGLDPPWYVQHVVVWDPQTDHMFFFLVEDWLSLENQKTGTVEKEVLASCPEELGQFRRVLTSQLTHGLVERHLWLSLWERPAHSRFTRAQRVTCGALLLHLYLALGALWYGAVGIRGHREPVSSHLLINGETFAVGLTVAVLVFPLQCFLCFLFRKAPNTVTMEMSVPPSPVCHSVEMDVYLGHSGLSGPSFLSLPDSSGPVRDSPSSLLESKALDSSILDFWAASGLAPATTGPARRGEGVSAWPSCDSLLNPPAKTTRAWSAREASPTRSPARQLRRKKALMQLHLAAPASHLSPTTRLTSSGSLSENASNSHQYSDGKRPVTKDTNPVQNQNLTTFLTLSEEDLLMSIAAAEDPADATNSNSDSGRDSPRTMSSFSTTRSVSCSSWSEHSEEKSLYGGEAGRAEPRSSPSLDGTGLYKCPSMLSVDSVASTFLPSPSPDSTRSLSATRIGVPRAQPGWLLPAWALSALYPLVAVLLGACLAAVGLYGSYFSRKVVLMWLASAASSFLASALLLEPLKVCVQALVHAALWRPVDPEVEERLAQEATVVRTLGEQSGKVRPPCGYGLLQAKEEARKVRALRSLMRHCVCQLLFLLLVLLLNYQDGVEQRQARLLRAAVGRRLHAAPAGSPNLTSLADWSGTEQWISHTLVPHLHRDPALRLMGSPRLRYQHPLGAAAVELRGNESETRRLVADLKTKEQFESLSIEFTHFHRETGLFVCVSIRLVRVQMQRITAFLSISPLLIPPSFSEPDLQLALTILLLLSALGLLFGQLGSVATERAQYVRQCHRCFQLFLALLTLATAILQLCFQSVASSCVSKLRAQPGTFVSFHGAALLAQRSSQCAALLLMLLVLKLLGTLRFVRRWVVVGGVLQRAWRELVALAGLALLLLLLCTHLGNTLFSGSVEGFLSLKQSSVSVLSVLRGRATLQRLCRVHPVLGPLYGMLLLGGCVWLLARLCGAVLIQTYRAEQAELLHPNIEPQDYEMVEFFIKRLKLWMGLTKAKQFRHRVKFEGMDLPPSRTSQESRLSNLSSPLPSPRSPSLSSSLSSPRPPSSALSVRSEDSSGSEPGFEVRPYLDGLAPCVAALLAGFDKVNQVTEDVHDLEIKLEAVQARRRKMWINEEEESKGRSGEKENPKESDEGKTAGEVRHKKTGALHAKSRISLPSSFPFIPPSLQSTAASICLSPRMRSSYSESESIPPRPRHYNCTPGFSAGSPGLGRIPKGSRRAWPSGSSHSADAAQRASQLPGASVFRRAGENLVKARPRSEEGARRFVSDGVPVKRKAWISEGPETEQD